MRDDGEIKAWWAEEIAHLERELADTLALRDKGRADEIAHLERKLAAVLEQRDKARTEKIAHLERERAAAIGQRDKAIKFLQVYRNDTPLGHQPHMIAHEVDQFLKECGKWANTKTLKK